MVRFTQTEGRKVVTRGPGGGGNGEACLMGIVFIWEDEKVLKMVGGDVRTTVQKDLMPQNYTL